MTKISSILWGGLRQRGYTEEKKHIYIYIYISFNICILNASSSIS